MAQTPDVSFLSGRMGFEVVEGFKNPEDEATYVGNDGNLNVFDAIFLPLTVVLLGSKVIGIGRMSVVFWRMLARCGFASVVMSEVDSMIGIAVIIVS